MTKQSANPRRYSRGPEGLDPTQPLSVFLALHIDAKAATAAFELLDYLAEQHPRATLDLAGYRTDGKDLTLTIEVGVGPARQALRGTSEQLHAGYDFLWDAMKTMYFANPVLCGPPHASERARVGLMAERPQLGRRHHAAGNTTEVGA